MTTMNRNEISDVGWDNASQKLDDEKIRPIKVELQTRRLKKGTYSLLLHLEKFFFSALLAPLHLQLEFLRSTKNFLNKFFTDE